jgi:hypothetical protein
LTIVQIQYVRFVRAFHAAVNHIKVEVPVIVNVRPRHSLGVSPPSDPRATAGLPEGTVATVEVEAVGGAVR